MQNNRQTESNESDRDLDKEDRGDKAKGTRKNKTIRAYNIDKREDGWVLIEITAQTNGRCSFKDLSKPDLRVFAIEKFRRISEQELWRDN